VSYAVFGPLRDAPAPYCVRGWAPDPQGRLQLVSEAFHPDIETVKANLPAGYEWCEPEDADRRELPRLVALLRPIEMEER